MPKPPVTNTQSRGRRAPRSRTMPAAIARAYERFLRIALSLPEAETSTSYGTPAVKVRGKLLSRWRTEAEGALVVRCDFLDRQILLVSQPDVFFLTDHYRDYPWILMRIEKASATVMAEAVERAWRLVAPAKLVRQRDGIPASPEKDVR
ncbi:MAG TPA: MmcQ/YjbR family DNA-binding protein [Steroidobacteraceae bacterium]|nr:MmcQ/YjbR family DNA-binding protein [Steroidobacteraceae bacterium]